MPKTTVFANEGRVWQLAGDTTEADHEELVPAADYPVQLWLDVTVGDGEGWFEALAGLDLTVRRAYQYDRGHEDNSYAVLAEFKSEQDLYTALCSGEFEVFDEEPPEAL